MVKGVFTDSFTRIDTNDGVGGVMIIKNRKGDTIDFSDKLNQITITNKDEAKEVIELINEGLKFL